MWRTRRAHEASRCCTTHSSTAAWAPLIPSSWSPARRGKAASLEDESSATTPV